MELRGKCLLVLASGGRSVVVRVNDSGWLTEAGRFSWDVRRAGDLDVAQYWADPGGLPVVLDFPPDAFRQISPHMETVEVRAYAVECTEER